MLDYAEAAESQAAQQKYPIPEGYNPKKFGEIAWGTKKRIFDEQTGRYYTKTRELEPEGDPRCNAKEEGTNGINMVRFEDDYIVYSK